jgi:hypothetical protein
MSVHRTRIVAAAAASLVVCSAFAQVQPFTLVTLPDTQNLLDDTLFNNAVTGLPAALVGTGPGQLGLPANRETLFNAQTHWIANNHAQQNIQFVSHLGDITQRATSTEMPRANAVFSRLDAIGPNFKYSTVPGNHDYQPTGSGKSSTVPAATALANYSATFGPSRYAGKSWYLGASANSANSAQRFTAGGREFLHIGIEFNPHNVFNNENPVVWAQGIIDANPGVPTILTTHAFIRDSTTPLGGNTGPNAGQDQAGVFLYRDLVRNNDQVFMTLNGHYHDLPASNSSDGERFEITMNNAGRPVYTLLSDYQDLPNGSDGYMRNYVFNEATNTIHAVTYSPRDGATNTATGATFHQASPSNPFVMPAGLPAVTSGTFMTDASSDFDIPFDFASRLSNIAAPQAAPKASFGANGFSENFDSMTDGVTPFSGREAPTGFRVLTLPGGNTTFPNASGGIAILPASDPLSSFSYTGFLGVNSTYGGTSPTLQTNNSGLNAAFASDVTDRILATSPTGVGAAGIELQLVNNSGQALNQIELSYDIVRLSAPSGADQLPGFHVFYSLDDGDSWTNIFNLNPTLAGPNGVVVPNSIGVTSIEDAMVMLNGDWNPGSTLFLRWMDDNGDFVSPDQIIGLNNVSIAVPEPTTLGLIAGMGLIALRRRSH